MQVFKSRHGAWLVAAVVLLSLPVVSAVDPDPNSLIRNSQSIPSQTTFDLFQTPYDDALEVARTAYFTDPGTWLLQAGNVGGLRVRRMRNSQKGFSLLELLIVMGIIAVLAGFMKK